MLRFFNTFQCNKKISKSLNAIKAARDMNGLDSELTTKEGFNEERYQKRLELISIAAREARQLSDDMKVYHCPIEFRTELEKSELSLNDLKGFFPDEQIESLRDKTKDEAPPPSAKNYFELDPNLGDPLISAKLAAHLSFFNQIARNRKIYNCLSDPNCRENFYQYRDAIKSTLAEAKALDLNADGSHANGYTVSKSAVDRLKKKEAYLDTIQKDFTQETSRFGR